LQISRFNPLRNVATNADMGRLHETFLVAAVSTILTIRTQLWLTNYPQLGGHGLHIAHLLWGGLFMVITIGLLLSLLGRRPRGPAAAQSRISLLGHEIRHRFLALTRKHWFERAIVIFFAIWATVIMLNLLTLVLALADGSEFESAQLNESGTFLAIAIVSSAAVAASFVLTGLLRIRRGQHQAGYEWLARGLLVSILVTQVFLFVQSQFGAVFGLGVDILLLVTVRAMGAEDRQTALVPERA
jgi:hypothetical protein